MWTDSTLGMKTTFGAYAFRNATAPAHATIVAKALQAGMIVLGKSNLGVRAHPVLALFTVR